MLLRELARGNMGVVHLAQDIALGRPAAVKLLSPDLAGNPRSVRGLRREAAILASIRHENVVQVYALGEHADSYYFAMEYVAGVDLDRLITEHNEHGVTVPLHRALTILDRIAQGLGAAHAAGIIHRDIKPANLMIEERTGRPVVIDFGLAVLPSGSVGQPAGTPAYVAPEQLSPAWTRIRPACDVYSLGCTAFELMTGREPFSYETLSETLEAHRSEPPPLVSSLRPELAPFDAVIARAMAKAADDRFQDGADFARALDLAASRWRRGETAALDVDEVTNPLRVMVIDDDADFRRLAARAVQLAFYRRDIRVKTVSSGLDALSAAAERMPDLILLDYEMPGLDGIDTLSRLRALARGIDARVLVTSARVQSTERWRFSVLGVNDFYSKSQGFEELIGAIKRLGEDSGLLPIDVVIDDAS
ncbi:MAG: protein kinase [Myxococcales bacterium]|nr:protein kinase [Myxococcales bacterium]